MKTKGSLWPAILLMVIVFIPGCDTTTPTEPIPQKAALIEATVVEGGPAGTLTVNNATCACLTVPLQISFEETPVGAVACGTERRFDVDLAEYRVNVSAYRRGTSFVLIARIFAASPDIGTILTVRCQ